MKRSNTNLDFSTQNLSNTMKSLKANNDSYFKSKTMNESKTDRKTVPIKPKTEDDELEERLTNLEKTAKEMFNEKPINERFSKKIVNMKENFDREMDVRGLWLESVDTNVSMLRNGLSYTNKKMEVLARRLEDCFEKYPLMLPEKE